MIKVLTILIIIYSINLEVAYSQKFMIVEGDTLLFKKSINNIYDDTVTMNNHTFLPGDTSFTHTCETFEKVKGENINYTNKACSRVGKWIIYNDDQTIDKGYYNDDGNRDGVWKSFDSNGKLIKKIEYVKTLNDIVKVEEIDYKNGEKFVIRDDPWLYRFYLKYYIIINLIGAFCFFKKFTINNKIYNIENNTNVALFYFSPFKAAKEFNHFMNCLFKFKWKINTLKDENKSRAKVSNIYSAISLALLLGIFFVSFLIAIIDKII
ncbi:MAG: hypothetical protein CVV25_03395 [Ignavibacteriae bacterium HGW-Ignavibacteriae-4]|jgi:hypothetical protein|nr:MAG: hypothetical protein CVV25_03395 [Ignavibacteriae bacterium HGW-Ignavibacteriae-4]